jgi:hypothetical protein
LKVYNFKKWRQGKNLGPFKYLSFYYGIEEKENPSFYNPPSFLGKKTKKWGSFHSFYFFCDPINVHPLVTS